MQARMERIHMNISLYDKWFTCNLPFTVVFSGLCKSSFSFLWAASICAVPPTKPSQQPPLFQQGFLGGSDGIESACSTRDLGSVLRLGRFPEAGNDYQLQCSCLENSMGWGAWQGTVHGLTKNWNPTEQVWLHFTSCSSLYGDVHCQSLHAWEVGSTMWLPAVFLPLPAKPLLSSWLSLPPLGALGSPGTVCPCWALLLVHGTDAQKLEEPELPPGEMLGFHAWEVFSTALFLFFT